MIDYISRSVLSTTNKKDHLESFHFFKINVLLKRESNYLSTACNTRDIH